MRFFVSADFRVLQQSAKPCATECSKSSVRIASGFRGADKVCPGQRRSVICNNDQREWEDTGDSGGGRKAFCGVPPWRIESGFGGSGYCLRRRGEAAAEPRASSVRRF